MTWRRPELFNRLGSRPREHRFALLSARLFICLLVALASLVAWIDARADAGPLPLERYWELVARTQVALSEMKGEPAEIHAQLEPLAAEWEAVQQVRLLGGEVVRVDHLLAVEWMRSEEPDLEKIKTYFDGMAALERDWPASRHTPADVEALQAILARPEFQQQQPNVVQRWLDEAWRKLLEWWAQLFGEAGQVQLGPGLDLVMAAAGSLALALVLYLALRSISGSLVVDARLGADGLVEEFITAEGALKKAQLCSSDGDYRSGVRYLYLSALLLLEERGLLRCDRTKTNREYLRSVAHLPELARSLRLVVEVFDRVWYGNQPVDEQAYREYEAEIETMRGLK